MRGARALLWPAVAAALAFALLVGLGTWQLRRLGEKEALIQRVEARATGAAADLPPRAAWATLKPQDYDFSHVRVSGRYHGGRDALIFTKPPEGFGREPGYLVLTPFAPVSGGVVLVERGFIPASKAADLASRAPPEGETTIVGLLHAPQTRNLFTPADEPARFIWYTRDPAAMSAALNLGEAAPFTIALEAQGEPGEFPRPVPAAPEIVNNHFSYAVTWFSLAFALVVIFALYARGRLGRGAL